LMAIKGVVTNDFIKSVEMVVCVATAISPLVLLNPKQYGKLECGREHMMSVRPLSLYLFSTSQTQFSILIHIYSMLLVWATTNLSLYKKQRKNYGQHFSV